MAVANKAAVFTSSVTFDGVSIESAYAAEVTSSVVRQDIKAGDSYAFDASPIQSRSFLVSILAYEVNVDPEASYDASIFDTDGVAELKYTYTGADGNPYVVTWTNAHFMGHSDAGAAQGTASVRRLNFKAASAPSIS